MAAYDERKFAELVLYVAERLADDPAGGALKLNKVLFFAEFAHVRAHGRPITGAEYQRLEHGPAPRRLVPVRDALVAAGDASFREAVYLGYKQNRLVATRPAKRAMFSPGELDVVDQVLAELTHYSGAQLSDLSHEDMGWRMVDDGETIPYEAAYLRRPVATDRIRRRASELAAQRLSR